MYAGNVCVNFCDVKLKANQLQESGDTSLGIVKMGPYGRNGK